MRKTILGVAVTTAALVLAVPATPAAASVPLPRCPQTSGGVAVAHWEHDVSTGTDYGTPHAIGTVDPEWTIEPGGGPTYSITPNSAWVTTPLANWINSRPTSASSGGADVDLQVEVAPGGLLDPLAPYVDTSVVRDAADAVGVGTVGVGVTAVATKTTFRTTFDVPGPSLYRTLSLTYAADNGVLFYLNGQPIGGYDPPLGTNGIPSPTAFNQLHTLVYTGPALADGDNRLDAVVTDYGVATGLLVSGSAEACVARVKAGICVGVRPSDGGLGFYTYPPTPYDLGTGEHAHVPFAPGTADDDWTVESPVTGPAYAVYTYPGWVGSSTSSWINAGPTPRSNLYGKRTYRIEFTFGSNATYRDIDIRYAADNGVLFYLNGDPTPIGGYDPPVPSSGIPLAAPFNQKHTLTYAGPGFVTGTNVLTAVVTDYGVASGLLVEGAARACYAQPVA